MTLKVVSNSDSGDADHIGGNDWDNLASAINLGESYMYLVKKSGSTYYVKNSAGEIAHSGATPQTEIQWALDNLTVGRTNKETVAIRGNITLTQITIPSYTVLDLTGARLMSANSANTNLIINSDGTGGNTQIEIFGGILDGNRANNAEDNGAVTPPLGQYGSRSTIHFNNVTDSSVHNLTSTNSNSCDLYVWGACQNVSIHDCILTGAEKSAIFFDGTDLSLGTAKYLYARNNYISGQDENPIASYGPSDIWIEGNRCIGNTVTSGINCNGSRVHINHNYLKDIRTIGLQIGVEGTYTTDDSEICYNIIDGAALSASGGGGISVDASAVSDRILVQGNRVKASAGQAFATAIGLRVSATENTIIKDNIVSGWNAIGMQISGSNTVFTPDSRVFELNRLIIADNQVFDNGKNTGLTGINRAGIGIANSLTSGYVAGIVKNLDIHGNICYDTGVATQLYGIYIRSTDDSWVHHNDVRGNVTAGLFVDANNVGLSVEKNKGYVTEASGSSTQSGNGTTTAFNIAHGLAAAPTKYMVVPGHADAVGPFVVTADATNVIVTYPNAPPSGSNNVVLRWLADVV